MTHTLQTGRDGSRVFYRAGQSYARGVAIDPYLTPEDCILLYKRWKVKWGEPLQFQGGEVGITCDMLVSTPMNELIDVYGKGRAQRLIDAARENA